jgi:alcohol dehydrogenase (cytochrome c)
MSRPLLGLIVAGVVVGLSAGLTTAQDRGFTPVTDEMLRNPSPNDWLSWRGTTRSQGYSPLSQINRRNVKQLQLAWSWAMDPGLQEPRRSCTTA